MTESSVQEAELVLLLSLPDMRPNEAARMLELLRAPLDWNLVLGMLTVHRVIGVAWHNYVTHAIAHRHTLACAYLFKSLGVTTTGQRIMAQEQIAYTSDLQKRLEDAGVRSAILKGGAVAALAYPDLGMRVFHDNDLLVDRSKLADAQAVLGDAGYIQGNWDYTTNSIQPSDRRRRILIAMSSHQTHSFMKPTPDASTLECHRVDLHFSIDLLTSNDSDAAVSSLLDGRTSLAGLTIVRDLDMLLFTCVHLATDAAHRDGVLALKDLVLNKFVDLLALLRQRRFSELPARATELGFAKQVFYALHYCNELFPSRVPSDLLDRLRPADVAYLDEVVDGATVVHRWSSPVVQRVFDVQRSRSLMDDHPVA